MSKLHMTESQFRYYRENYIGICLECQAESDSCEPDAEDYHCDECEADAVQGIENLLICGHITIKEDDDDKGAQK